MYTFNNTARQKQYKSVNATQTLTTNLKNPLILIGKTVMLAERPQTNKQPFTHCDCCVWKSA